MEHYSFPFVLTTTDVIVLGVSGLTALLLGLTLLARIHNMLPGRVLYYSGGAAVVSGLVQIAAAYVAPSVLFSGHLPEELYGMLFLWAFALAVGGLAVTNDIETIETSRA